MSNISPIGESVRVANVVPDAWVHEPVDKLVGKYGADAMTEAGRRQGISAMKTTRGIVTVVSLDDGTGRLAIQVDGVVSYVGSPEECQRRLNILKRDSPDPSERDRALGRAIRHS